MVTIIKVVGINIDVISVEPAIGIIDTELKSVGVSLLINFLPFCTQVKPVIDR